MKMLSIDPDMNFHIWLKSMGK